MTINRFSLNLLLLKVNKIFVIIVGIIVKFEQPTAHNANALVSAISSIYSTESGFVIFELCILETIMTQNAADSLYENEGRT
uniref:Uncharacterized protein n=1 Tax=Glossina brevipalpis TaxID=37001 RepID=A0A1A9WCS8_9MUSC